MINSLNLKTNQVKKKQQFQEFIFIGNTAKNSVSNATKQLNLSPNSKVFSQANMEESLLITEILTTKNIIHQLENLKIEPGVTVKLVSKTNNGSVVVSLGNKLVGLSAEIASKIVATTAL